MDARGRADASACDGGIIADPMVSLSPPLRPRSVLSPIVDLGSPRTAPSPSGAAVKVWAAIGAAWVVFATVGWARWVLSANDFRAAPRGSDSISSFHLAFIHGYQVFAMGLLITMIVTYVVRPWFRTRRLSMDGMLLIACSYAYFVDTVINIFHSDTFAWNAYAFNLGSWGNSWPGHIGSAHYAEGLAWALPDYICFGLLAAVVGCRMLAWLRQRFPGLGTLGALGAFWVAFFVVSSVVEVIRVRLELYGYARTWTALTLWPGKQYQWPLYEGFFSTCCATAFLYIRWSWIIRGRSFVDSGSERLGVGTRTRTAILTLALIGFAAATYGVLYFLPWSWQSISADSIAHLPSYMRPGP